MSINDFEENEPEIIELDADELPGLIGFIKKGHFMVADSGFIVTSYQNGVLFLGTGILGTSF